ncbi:MAG: chorismate mutase [Spirochaetaceae bacterium]|nr:chorismate mutase [Spirochaetaceae bacterium]
MPETLENLRNRIDEIDEQIAKLFAERMDAVEKIGIYKKDNALGVNQAEREKSIVKRLTKLIPAKYASAIEQVYDAIFATSKRYQSKVIGKAKFGLIGRNISYSFSKEIHAAFADYDYEIINLEPEEVEGFFAKKEYAGCNVTIPYKRDAAALCDELSPQAKAIGSVNTVILRKDGTLFGDNTDYYGFLNMAEKAGVDFNGKKVLVFGNGATSATICAAVKDKGGNVTVISRNGKTTYADLPLHKDAQILINATPVGTYPETENQITSIEQFEQAEAVLDVVYTPLASRFVQQGLDRGLKASGGLPMLVGQAKKAAELFAGKTISKEQEEKVFHKILRQKQNLILIGMPGSGKTSLGKAAAEKLNRPFIDLDTEIEKREHLSIPEIFAKFGESHFRAIETEVIAEIAKTSGAVIATGGGAVMNRRNRLNLRQNGFCVFIKRDQKLLAVDGRPVSKAKGTKQLEKERMPVYKELANAEIENNGKLEDALNQLLEAFK